jgi:hypothetical protein
MDNPKDIHIPFFAYGVFRPGQLGFFQLKDLIAEVIESSHVRGTLLLRDGLPIIDPLGGGHVKGAMLRFIRGHEPEAYARISALEPGNHYRWDQVEANGRQVNALLGRSPKKGSVPFEDEEWDGWSDPLFTSALDVVEETLQDNKRFEWDLKPLFKLQMAYLLLWSAIERYVSLRYHLGDKVIEKVNKLSREASFREGLRSHVTDKRELYRADRPGEKVVLDSESPEKALEYYYQIRSNIIHRGKAVVRDHDRISHSLAELVKIFRGVLAAAKIEASSQTSGTL